MVETLPDSSRLLSDLSSRCRRSLGASRAVALLFDGGCQQPVSGGAEELVPLADALGRRFGRDAASRRLTAVDLGGDGAGLWIPITSGGLAIGAVLVVGDDEELPEAPDSEVLCDVQVAAFSLRAAQELRIAWFRRDRLTWFGLRRVAKHWAEVAESQGSQLCLGILAVEGLSGINRSRGMAAGDEAYVAAIEAAFSRLPPERFCARLLGAAAAVLLIGEEAGRVLQEVLQEAEREVADRHGVKLRLGIATLLPAQPCDAKQLVANASRALDHARRNGDRFAYWRPELTSDGAQTPPDLDELAGPSYQRISAVWRLFDALTSEPDLDELLQQTLSAVAPVLAAERASLWTLGEQGGWQQRFGEDNEAHAPELVAASVKQGSAVVWRLDGCASLAVPAPLAPPHLVAFCFTGSQLRTNDDTLAFVSRLADQIGKVLRNREALEWALRRKREVEERLRAQTRELRRMVRARAGLIGTSPVIRDVLRRVERAAPTKVPVLVAGETGTGKEVAARIIHRNSRRDGPFVIVDCGAIPASLLESELFGHEKGAFTGAEARKIGRFEQACGGTLFLDEIGELPLELQPKLLRVLQDSTIRRIGGTEEIHIDFRLIAATHRNLKRMVAAGNFREDLVFRLRVIEIELPPLRERGDDVLLLAYHFLREYCCEMNRDFLPLNREAEARLMHHRWPGNVRELQNVLRRAVAMAPGPELTAEDLHLALASSPENLEVSSGAAGHEDAQLPARVPSAEEVPTSSRPLGELAADWLWATGEDSEQGSPIDAVHSLVLRTVLHGASGNLRRAANALGVSSATLRSRLDRLGHPQLSRSLQRDAFGVALQRRALSLTKPGSAGELLEELDGVIMRELFLLCRGNKSRMARLLGWGRQTLLRRLNEAAAHPDLA